MTSLVLLTLFMQTSFGLCKLRAVHANCTQSTQAVITKDPTLNQSSAGCQGLTFRQHPSLEPHNQAKTKFLHQETESIALATVP